MLSIAYYFLQVMCCSAVMMGYYWLALRNKRFHQYNRFYLLTVLILSWLIPMIKIQWNKPVATDTQVINFLSLVADRNTEIESNIVNHGFQFNWEWAAIVLYVGVAAMLSTLVLIGLIRLYSLLKKHSCKMIGDVYLIFTQVKGTPFSFFRYIFWHESIDLRSEAGKQMLEHELTHVKEKHSLDKLLIQLVLIAGWFNPFFWLLKKEMELIHEFIADQKAVRNGDTASLAQLLLTAAYPQQQFMLTNPFFFSPIKRRLAMIAHHKNPKFSYMRRIAILPLLAIVIVLFAFRSKDARVATTISVGTLVEKVVQEIKGEQLPLSANNEVAIFPLNKKYIVVIDAGHGGSDHGAVAPDGTTEANINLELAKMIASANQHPDIKIVLTRNSDQDQTVLEKANMANEQHADLFISLHCNTVNDHASSAAASSFQGIEMYVATKAKAVNYDANISFANHIANHIKDFHQPFLGVKTRGTGIYVLQAVKAPSVLIEAGFLSNATDLQQMKDASYQRKLAQGILNGVQQYLLRQEQIFPKASRDTVVKDTVASGMFTISDQKTDKQVIGDPLIVLDGVKKEKDFLNKINPGSIESINVLKGESATKLYGEDGRNGVIMIVSKKPNRVDTVFVVSPDSKLAKVPTAGVKLSGIKPLYVVDGKITELDSAFLHQKVVADQIKSVNIIKGKDATGKYGAAGANGVIEILLKPKPGKTD